MGRKLSNIYTPYSILFFIFFTLLFLFSNTNGNADEITSSIATPVKAVDGDSFEIGSRRIRLMGIDAPEYKQYCKDKQKKKYPCGKDSLKYLQNLIGTSAVKCTVHQKDKYNRDLCTCYVNDININAEMVRSGHAIVYLGEEYKQEEAEAKKAHRGIWRGRFMHPRLFRRLQEEQK